MNKQEKNEIENILNSIPNDFKVIENKINAKTIDEYYKIVEDLKNRNPDKIIQDQDKWTELRTHDLKE